MATNRVSGHAFNYFEVTQRWTSVTGLWHHNPYAACECGASETSGVNNLSAARQWHREHKQAILEGPVVDYDLP